MKYNKKERFSHLVDLVSEGLGGKVLYATDDFFAEKENLIKEPEPIFIPDKYTDNGKWMDGWESRRKRIPGHDWCIVKLAVPGRIQGFDIDTSHFMGNHPPHASIEGVLIFDDLIEDSEFDSLPWKEILTRSPLDPGSHHLLDCTDQGTYNLLRLHIYPDGGVARLRAYGQVVKDWTIFDSEEEIDLASALHGGMAIYCNDMFFSDMKNLLNPGRGANMGDGWETKRNRVTDNFDWVIIRLAHPGILSRALIDTCHFKGNYPDSYSLEGCYSEKDEDVLSDAVDWLALLPRQKLGPDQEHEHELIQGPVVSHVRMKIYPDGGVSRLRLIGKIRG